MGVGVTPTLEWTIPDTPYSVPGTFYAQTAGQTYDVSQHVADLANIGVYSITAQSKNGVAGSYGFTVNQDTGLISVPSNLENPASTDSYDVVVDLGTPGVEITTLTLSGAGAWTFGQPFKKGDAPAYVTVDGGQAEVRNRWSDGSVKFAVLSGISTGAGNVSITTSATDTMSGTAVAEPTLAETSVDFGAFGKATLVRTAQGTWNKATAGRVRSIPGPVMSEFHYYAPASSDAHLAVWWYVRAYSNGAVEVETVVENGWLLQAGPTQKDYTPTVKVNGATVYSTPVTHYHHSRWSRVDWVNGSALTPTHNTTYLKATKLVPNFGSFGAPQTATYATFTQTATPMSRGNWRDNWPDTGDTGNTDHIGILPPWEALYITSGGDLRAYNAVIANARMAGSFSSHFRDDSTGRAPSFVTRRLNTIEADITFGTGGQCCVAFQKDTSHTSAFGFLPYLLTGRWLFMDEAQQWASFNFLCRTASYREYELGLWAHNRVGVSGLGQGREQAWGIRQLALTTAITPDSDTTLRSEYRASLDANIEAIYASSVAPTGLHYNQLGIVRVPDNYGPLSLFKLAPWQQDFIAGVIGWTYDLGVSEAAHLTDVRNHCYRFITGRLGGIGGGYCFRNLYAYTLRVASVSYPDSSDDYFTTFLQMYEANDGVAGGDAFPTPPSCGAGESLLKSGSNVGATDFTLGYIGNAQAAIAYAVDHGATDAAAAYARLTGSSSWALSSNFADAPKWGVVPR